MCIIHDDLMGARSIFTGRTATTPATPTCSPTTPSSSTRPPGPSGQAHRRRLARLVLQRQRRRRHRPVRHARRGCHLRLDHVRPQDRQHDRRVRPRTPVSAGTAPALSSAPITPGCSSRATATAPTSSPKRPAGAPPRGTSPRPIPATCTAVTNCGTSASSSRAKADRAGRSQYTCRPAR